tara:strand:+ start:3738 stop:4013 length:276 start_codon:yes stop_codon:yes gene_type:complete
MTSSTTAAVTIGAKMARSSLQLAAAKLSDISDVSGIYDTYVHIESAAHDNIKARNKFPVANYEKGTSKGNKKTKERDRERREKYEKCVSEW